MFQYAFYLRLRKEHPLSLFLFDTEKSQSCHWGYELDKVFHIGSIKKARNYRRLKKYFPKFESTSRLIQQENSLKYSDSILSVQHLCTTYEGFWQSAKYFSTVEKDVRKTFTFHKDTLKQANKTLAYQILTSDSPFISVHVRRGDYLQEEDFRGVCSVDYYRKAIEYLTHKVDNPRFIFFSDDIEWVKREFYMDKSVFVDWNKGDASWQDMYLMTLCSHNIIANSSFSWWGAWLNENTNKIVIAPRRWFLNSENYDILPEDWIKL